MAVLTIQQQQELAEFLLVEEELEALQPGCSESRINNQILQRVIFIHILIKL